MLAPNVQRKTQVCFDTNSSTESETYIYRLNNSFYYFLDFVIIIVEEDGFRLLAFDKGENFLVDRTYRTVTAAKISFLKYFGHKYYDENPVAEWSDAYPPDRDWLDGIESFVSSLPKKCKEKRMRGEKVSFLSNPSIFGLDYGFIIDQKFSYRLIVHDRNEKILFDNTYNTVAAAKIAFSRLFVLQGQRQQPKQDFSFPRSWSMSKKNFSITGYREAFETKNSTNSFKPVWMPFCQPIKSWWKHKMRFIESIPRGYKQKPG